MTTIDDATVRSIENAVDQLFDEEVQRLQEFVRIPSQRDDGDRAQQFIHDLLAGFGYNVDQWAVHPADLEHMPGFSPAAIDYTATSTVVGHLTPPRHEGRSLILQGHTDIVPIGPKELWTGDPYSADIRDGWMYGRGAGDMKNGLIACIYAVQALRHAGYVPTADVYIQSVLEEESTCHGALSTIQRGYRADGVLVAEPQGLMYTSGQTGVLWVKLRLLGRAAHAAVADRGSNAVEAAMRFVDRLRDLEARWNERARQEPYFDRLERPVVLNLGKIEGGDWASSVPSWCEVHLRIGVTTDHTAAQAREELQAEIDRIAHTPEFQHYTVTADWNGYVADAYVVPEDSPVLAVLSDAHQCALGEPLRDDVVAGLNDCHIYARYGMDAICYGAIAEDHHNADERVNLDSLRKVTHSLAVFIAEWCGYTPIHN